LLASFSLPYGATSFQTSVCLEAEQGTLPLQVQLVVAPGSGKVGFDGLGVPLEQKSEDEFEGH